MTRIYRGGGGWYKDREDGVGRTYISKDSQVSTRVSSHVGWEEGLGGLGAAETSWPFG